MILCLKRKGSLLNNHMNFKEWTAIREGRKELATAYKQTLSGVPQDPVHHPEGDVLNHVRLVRKAIPKAIQELQIAQTSEDSTIHDILADMNFSLTPKHEQIIALSAWLHDIGKATATTIDGKPWQTAGTSGRIQAIGHQDYGHYRPQMEKLKSLAPQETIDLYVQNEELINWLIEHHMDFASGQGFSKRFVGENFNGHRVKDTLRMKLLLILMWADKMGRKPEDTITQAIGKNANNLVASSERAAKRSINMANQSTSFQGGPEDFANVLKQRQMSPQQRMGAIRGKYPHLSQADIERLVSEGFRNFMENMQPTTVEGNISIPKECMIIAEALTKGYPKTEVYAVGGAVRDYLFGKQPKDVDLTVNITEQEIIERVEKAGLSAKDKDSETFGVVFVHTNSGEKEPTEVAPFRTDVGVSDGRRPDQVKFGVDITEDAMRRDFTMNNLYYDFGFGRFGKNLIIDFNPDGQGIQDVKNKVVRPVGDPMERFVEDRFRILRLMRFFSRFNDGDVSKFLDDRTMESIENLGNLRQPFDLGNGQQLQPISGERIQSEFIKGLEQSKNTAQYLQNFVNLGLMDQVFPGLNVDVSQLHTLQNSKNPKVVFAWLLKGNNKIADKLNSLNYPNRFNKPVQFLVDALTMGTENAFDMIKKRDQQFLGRKAVGANSVPLSPQEIEAQNHQISVTMSRDLQELARLTGNRDIINALTHLGGKHDDQQGWHHEPYKPPVANSQDLMQQGFKGPELGNEIKRQATDHYNSSLQNFVNQNKSSL